MFYSLQLNFFPSISLFSYGTYLSPSRISELRVVELLDGLCEKMQDYTLGKKVWLLQYYFRVFRVMILR